MKIGINASFLRKPGTGIGQVTVNFLRALSEYRSTSSVYRDAEFFLYCEEEPKHDFPLPEGFHERVFLPLWKRDDLIRKMLWEKRLAREAAKDGCQALISLYQSGTVVPETMRHTMIVHDIIPRLFPRYRDNLRQALHWKAVERGIAAADSIVAVSEHTKNDLTRELGIGETKISVAYPDVAPRFHTPLSSEAVANIMKKYDLETGYIYSGGGFEVRKNTEAVLRAYAILCDKEKQGKLVGALPPLVLSGKIFPTINQLATDVRSLIHELHLENKTRLLGFVPEADIPALYRGALFFVYPSLYEGFGLPVLEALRMGVPVLSSGTTSLPEVGSEAVLSVDPHDIGAIAAQMERLCTDETLRATLVSRSAAQAARFSWENFVKKVLATLT